MLEEDFSSLLFDDDDLSEDVIVSLLDDVSLYADEDSTCSLLEETFESLDEDVSFLD